MRSGRRLNTDGSESHPYLEFGNFEIASSCEKNFSLPVMEFYQSWHLFRAIPASCAIYRVFHPSILL